VDRLNRKYQFKLEKHPGGFAPSDQTSFYAKKVPVFFFCTGTHLDYHRPSDTAEKINVPGMKRVTDLVEDLVAYLATTKERPKYIYIKGVSVPGGRMGGPKLGIMPGYGREQPGVLVRGIVRNGPADKGGLKDGDIIVELAGKPVKNIQAYMVIMRGQKNGKEISITVLRKGKKVVLKVKPQ
jgi:hypothetical protein